MAPRASTHTSEPAAGPLDPRRRVVLCVGPGGVGKTTCAATLALGAARRGLKVLVVTIDPSRRLAQALGFGPHTPPGAELVIPTPELAAPGSLHALLLDGKVVFDRLVRAYAGSEEAAATVLRNPIYKATAEHLGGALEYAAIAQLQFLHDEGRHDLLVLDTPPTANAIDFLAAPDRIQELVTNPALRLLTGTGKLGARVLGIGNGIVLKVLATMGGGAFVEDLGEFLREFSGVLQAFREHAGDFHDLLTSPATGVVLTTSASQFSVREALSFLEILHRRSMRVDAVVLNRLLPMFEAAPPVEAVRAELVRQRGDQDSEAELAALLAAHAGIRIQGERSREAITALTAAYPKIPVWALPRREPPPNSLPELRELGEQFVKVAG
ncbi:MAG: ArsA-related P-loop ATPase [Nannocystaceae bacterium]